jgi:hypothetical protein
MPEDPCLDQRESAGVANEHGGTPTCRDAETPVPPRTETIIERIIGASARNPFLVVVFVIFGIAGGIYALYQTPLDAIPDLSDVQVIVYADWEGRSPDLVEDQITYPIST